MQRDEGERNIAMITPERFNDSNSEAVLAPRAALWRSSRAFRRSLAAIATSIVVMAAPVAFADQAAQLEGPSGFVYTADEFGNSISQIDLTNGQVETVPVPISPHNVQITPDEVWLLAVGDPAEGAEGHGHDAAGEEGKAPGRLLVFNAAKLSAVPIASIEVGDHPAHVVTDPQGLRAFVTLAGENAIALVDLNRNEVVQKIPVGKYPHGLRISPDGKWAYIADVEENAVSVVDTTTLSEVARIPVGKAPVQVGFTPDGSRVYVSLRDENKVAVIDTASRSVIAQVPVGSNPIQVYATPDGAFMYVANQGTKSQPADTVSVIDVARGDLAATIRTGAGAHGVSVSSDGRYVFVSNIVDGTVSIIDTATLIVTDTIPVGKGPNGITFRSGNM
jgi:YVTN family beta-propeller protein